MGGGEDGGEGVNEVGGGAAHDGALMESFTDEVNLATGEIADSTVNEFGRAGGGGLGKVACFDEGRSCSLG